MLLRTAFENVDRCLRKARRERREDRRHAWLYTARRWRRFIPELVLMRPGEEAAIRMKIGEIEAEAAALGTSLDSRPRTLQASPTISPH